MLAVITCALALCALTETSPAPMASVTVSANCGSGYTYYPTRSCYKLHTEHRTWDEANATCSDEGGYLAVINEAEEARTVVDIAWGPGTGPQYRYPKWVGLRETRTTRVSEWRSVRGDVLSHIYNVWRGVRADRAADSCAVVRHTAHLDDYHCTNPLPFLCEKN